MINAGQLNRVVTFEVWQYTQDDAGGTTGSVIDSWQQRAAIEDRSSYNSASAGQSTIQAQQQWSSQFKITVRFLRTISSKDTLIYEGFRYIINEAAISSEGHKRFYVLRCAKNERLF